jgi:putative addiction module component (TIGR02574 family)
MDPLKVEGAPASALALAEYARISIAFEVREVLEVGPSLAAMAGRPLVTRPLSVPYVKDYDAFAGEGPLRWAASFDLAYWRLFVATLGSRNVGAAAVVLGSPEVDMCEARSDLAVLWDIRVSLEERRHGWDRRSFAPSRTGRQPTEPVASRSRLKTRTSQRADSMRGKAACSERSGATRIQSYLTRFSCSGTSSSWSAVPTKIRRADYRRRRVVAYSPDATPAIDVERLTRDEQLELLEKLWDSLGRDPAALPLTEEQTRDLDERLDELERDGAKGMTWDEAVEQIRSK